MVEELADGLAVVGVLLQAGEQEVIGLLAQLDVAGDFNFVFDDLDEFFLLCYFEGVLSHHHLVHHHPQRPDVDFLIVFLPPQDLGTYVEGSPAEGRPHILIPVHRPPEITQFDHILE